LPPPYCQSLAGGDIARTSSGSGVIANGIIPLQFVADSHFNTVQSTNRTEDARTARTLSRVAWHEVDPAFREASSLGR
jgi:hypothetical protein